MTFSWIEFFRSYHIEFVERGPNVAAGNVNVHCPFCGASDPSHHLGVSKKATSWGCWRNPQHRGRSPVRLIAALLGCSRQEAMRIAGVEMRFIPPDSMSQAIAAVQRWPSAAAPRKLALPTEFKPFQNKPSFSLFRQYLENRDYTKKQILEMTGTFGLRYCTSGPFRGRIIFPVTFENKLVTWTGRSIYPSEELRYKTLTPNEERAAARGHPPALGPINSYLLWYDELLRGPANILMLVEGPFDALRVSVLGRKLGVVATCFFTMQPTRAQVELLWELVPRFRKTALVLDQGTEPVAIRLTRLFRGLNISRVQLPDRYKDPGELDKPGLLHLLQNNF